MKNTLPKEIKGLQEELIRLSKESLPVKNRAALVNASQVLDQFEQQVADVRTGERLAALYAVSKSLGTSLNLDEVLNQAMDAIIQLTGAERGFLALVDRDTGALEIHAARNFERKSIPKKDIEISTTLVQSVFQSGKGIVTTDASSDPRFANQESVILYTLRSILCSPLQTRGVTIGVIYVDHRARSNLFTQEDLEILDALASQAAAAIENARLHQAIQDTNESKSQFVSIVTHELRVPLTSIKGYTDLMRQGAVGPINESQKEFLKIIRNNADRMAALISDLSDISRIERGILRLDPVFIPLNGYVDATINRLKPDLEGKAQLVNIQVPATLPEVYADPNRLVQILTNLISNAIKYTPEKGTITIQATHTENQVRVEVADNGIGISAEDQAKLFSQFFRSESLAVREQTGWGLGLNVTKRLIEVMGGSIGFTSQPGKGSTFWFSLPTQTPDA